MPAPSALGGSPYGALRDGDKGMAGSRRGRRLTSLLVLVVTLPAARALFGFGVLHADDILSVALAVGLLGLALALMRRRHGRRERQQI